MEQQMHFDARAAALAERVIKALDPASFRMLSALRRKLSNRAALWAPFGRSLTLRGIKLPGGEREKVLTGPPTCWRR
eukprot:4796889-Pyramimonas_sp.AAC.1